MHKSHVFSGLFYDCRATPSINIVPFDLPKWSQNSAICCPFRCPICCPISLEKGGVVPVLSPIDSISLGRITLKYGRPL